MQRERAYIRKSYVQVGIHTGSKKKEDRRRRRRNFSRRRVFYVRGMLPSAGVKVCTGEAVICRGIWAWFTVVRVKSRAIS